MIETMAQRTNYDNAIEPASTAGREQLLERKEGAYYGHTCSGRSSPVGPYCAGAELSL